MALSASLYAQSALENALELTRQKHYAEARLALKGEPEPTDLNQRIAFHRLRAAIASGLGEPAAAVQEMRDALALAPNDSRLLLATAVSEMQAGMFDDGLRHAESAGNTPMARAIVGDIEDKRGDYAAAANAYQAAVSLAPDQESYRLALATELIQHQSFAAAIELLKQSEHLFPRSAKLRTLLGIANYANGFPDDAIAEFENAIAIDQKFDSAYRCLTELVLESSAPPKPKEVRLLCQWNSVACSAVQLRIAREKDDGAGISKAIASLERASNETGLASCELARGYEWSHQLEAARRQMEACVHLQPTPQNHYRLGMLYQRLGLAAQARQQMTLRNEAQAKMSEETAAGLNALQSFKLAVK